MQRRELLMRSAALAGWSLLPLGAAAAASDGRPRKLVVVMLRGAVDGLSVVVPYADRQYAEARPTLALPAPGAEDGVLALDAHFGLHPALSRLKPYWDQGALGFVHASGSPDSTRSHFDAQEYMETGTPGRKATPDGWMNRLLAALPGPSAPTRAVSMGTVPARIFSGPGSVASLGTGPRALQERAIDDARMQAALSRLYANDPVLGKVYRDATGSRSEMKRSLAQGEADSSAAMGPPMAGERSMDPNADNGAPPPRSFAADAFRLGRLIRNDAHTQLAFTSVGGWDTHAAQGASRGQLATKLGQLGDGLDALARGLGDALQHTVIVVMSEFGRTVAQNGTGGTDHGRGNVMWLLGGAVSGGQVLGDWPGLDRAALADGRDLAVTTDFRHVLGAVLERHLAVGDDALSRVFPGFDGPWAPASRLLRST
ncbi:DUF1501 domain-containing protein [Schlegelella sp. S2-27]|uniref:DUF1501 domain-containing protein n=1 Tax=Caldimonas mangrovi TaxID=2944811 RepID=A0ABT0YKT0_9BURK|nr:DUF1501 domain-containing protein [Caldimonas mangrovi]MCM5679346.1 DUF1501 domain-containing protein [Caldimonas mangrovi]